MKKYTAPRIQNLDRVVALLQVWAAWRGTTRQVLLRHMHPKCTLGRLVKAAQQDGELWAHNETPEPEIFDDALLVEVSQIVASLPVQHAQVIGIEYVDLRGAPGWVKARRAGISGRHYRRVLREAHETVDRLVDWRIV